MTTPGGLKVVAVDTVTGEVMPAGDRAGWTDDEWDAYIRAADPGEAIKARAVRIYEFADECPRCQGGSHFSAFMRERFGLSQPAASLQRRLGEELISNTNKFESLTIADDWYAWAGVATADDSVVEQLAEEGGIVDQKRIKEAKREHKRRLSRPAPETLPESFAPELHHCSLESLPVEPGSIDAVITDPPYPREFLPLYGTLAESAARWLRPGGSLVVMCGQSYLPDILALMVPHIRYQWMIAYVTSGEHTTHQQRRIANIGWKPVLWFVNGDGEQPQHLGFDVVTSDGNDKTHHHWGQSESGMQRLIDAFTVEGETVCDPFLGGGTTAIVACRSRRHFIGCDVDDGALEATRGRIA